MKSIIWKTDSVAEFPNIQKHWDDLNKRNTNQAVMSARFVGSILKNFGSGDELLIQGWLADVLIFAGVFAKRSVYRWSVFQPSQAPVGIVLSDQGELNNTILGAVARCLSRNVLTIDLTQLDSALYHQSLENCFFLLPYINTGSLELPEDFDSYFLGLSKNSRQNYNKSKNRLAKEDISIRLDIVRDKNRVEDLVEKYGRLESKGWKSTLGTAVQKDNEQGRFYIDMLSTFADTGDAQIWCYYFNEKIVAIDLCIILDGTLTILKTTFDEDFARYSPSLLMKIDAYKMLSQSKIVSQIEYFGKVMDWHRRLKCQERPIFHATWCKYPSAYRLLAKCKALVNSQRRRQAIA